MNVTYVCLNYTRLIDKANATTKTCSDVLMFNSTIYLFKHNVYDVLCETDKIAKVYCNQI